MENGCTHNCESCSSDCSSRTQKNSFLEEPHELSHIKRVIGVMSGKGGVGKSLVTSLLALTARRAGQRVAILDADITGPSIPRAFGIAERATADESGLYPARTRTGIDVMSLNLLTDSATDPVLWRGPILASVVKQFWSEVVWGEKDFMFIDMPPGTGDVPLTVFQSIPLSGVVVVATPQELVGMIVEKALHMAQKMNVPVLGLVENMSYFECPSCAERHNLFGESRIDALAARYGIQNVAKLPIDPALAAACDSGRVEEFPKAWLEGFFTGLVE